MDINNLDAALAKADWGRMKKQPPDISGKPLEEKALKEACAGFEAIFLNTLLKSMRESLPGDGLFQESNGMNIYKSMYDQYLSEELSNSNTSVGLKEFLFDQLKESI